MTLTVLHWCPNGVATMTTVFKQIKITHRIGNKVLGCLHLTRAHTNVASTEHAHERLEIAIHACDSV